MKSNTGFKSALLASSGLILLMASTMNAGAQNVSISGENALVENPCRTHATVSPIVTAPEPCATVTYTPLAPSSSPTFTLTDFYQTGIIIGKDGHGEVHITDGGLANTAHLVVGNEKDASGIVIVSGDGSEYLGNSTTSVGNAGKGELFVRDGGVYRHKNVDYFYAGYQETGNGYVEVSGVSSTGQRSSIITRNRMYVGVNGDATLNILDGGLVSAEYTSVIGENSSSTSSIIVSGVNAASGDSSTFRVLNNQLWVGDYGNGTLGISDGGLVEVQDGVWVGGEAGGLGFLHLDGVDEATGRRSTVKSNHMSIGHRGEGVATVTGGATIIANYLYTGYSSGSISNLLLAGVSSSGNERSTITVNNNAYLGREGTANNVIEGGSLLDIANDLFISYESNSNSAVNVNDSGTEVIVGGTAYVAYKGTGVLNLSDGGAIDAGAAVIAEANGTKGTINIGTGNLSGALNAPTISAGLGDATINFNHIDDIDFAPVMTGNIKVNQINTGATTLTAANDYSGLTTISAGALRAGGANVFSSNSDHLVEQNGTLDLNGFGQMMRNLDNAGLVRFGGAGGTVLEVSDTYKGNGGTIEFNTVLGDDASLTDKMIAQETEGTSFIRVNNAGGTGAQTNDGIQLIEVLNRSDATFSLLGDYVFEGDQAVVGGAYAYRLYQGATSAPNDGNWYLRSSLIPTDPEVPLYQPGVPVYESYPQSLLGLNGLATLQQRVGNRYWAGNGNRVVSQGADTIEYYAPAEEAGSYTDGNGVWGRIEGAHNKVDPKLSSSGTDYSQNVFRMQAGIDMLLNENMDGMLIGGVFAHYAHGKTKVRSIYGDGTISTNGYGFGGSVTWYGNEGFYVDGQAQATWYSSDLASTLAQTSLVSGNKGFGYALSLETGKRFALTPEWSLTPQAQLTYSNVDFDSFRDVWNTHVSLDKGSRFEGRLGLSLDHESSWQNAAGMTDRAHVYGIANLYYGFSEGTRVNVANEQFTQEQERLWGGLGVGGSYNWNDDKYSIYGEGLVNTSLNSFGDSYSLKGNVGFRVKW